MRHYPIPRGEMEEIVSLVMDLVDHTANVEAPIAVAAARETEAHIYDSMFATTVFSDVHSP